MILQTEIKWIFNANSSKSHLLLFCFFSSTLLQYWHAARYQVWREERSLRPLERKRGLWFLSHGAGNTGEYRQVPTSTGRDTCSLHLPFDHGVAILLRFCLPLLASSVHSGDTLLLAISVNTFLAYLHNWAVLSMGVNPWKLLGFMCIKTTYKHISKQIASAHGCLLGTTTLWMYIVLKCKVAWHFNTYTSTKMKVWKWMLPKKQETAISQHTHSAWISGLPVGSWKVRISLYVPQTLVCFDYLLSSSGDFQLNFHDLQRSFLQQ